MILQHDSSLPEVLRHLSYQELEPRKKCDDKEYDENDTNAFTFRVPKPQDHNYASYEHSFGINGPTRGQDWLWEPEMSDKDFGPPIEPFARPPHLRQRKIVSRFRERLHEDDHVSGVAGPVVGRGEDDGQNEGKDSSAPRDVSTKLGLPKLQDNLHASGRKVTPPRRRLQKKRPEDKSVASRKVSSSSSRQSHTPSNLVPGEGVPATPPVRPLTNAEANAAQLGISTSPLKMIQRTAKKVAGFFGVIQESDTASTSVTDTSTDTDGDQRERAAQQFIERSTLPHRVLPNEEPSDEPPKNLRDCAGFLDPAAERRMEERLVRGVHLAEDVEVGPSDIHGEGVGGKASAELTHAEEDSLIGLTRQLSKTSSLLSHVEEEDNEKRPPTRSSSSTPLRRIVESDEPDFSGRGAASFGTPPKLRYRKKPATRSRNTSGAFTSEQTAPQGPPRQPPKESVRLTLDTDLATQQHRRRSDESIGRRGSQQISPLTVTPRRSSTLPSRRRSSSQSSETSHLSPFSGPQRSLTLPGRRRKASITTESLHEQAALLEERRRRSGSPTKQQRLDEENAEPMRERSREALQPSPVLQSQVEQVQPPTVLSVAQQLRRDNSNSSRNTHSSRYSDEEPDTDESEGGRRGSPELGRAVERSLSPERNDDEGDDLWSGTHGEDCSSGFWSRALWAFDDVYEMLLPTLDEEKATQSERRMDGPTFYGRCDKCEELPASEGTALDEFYLASPQDREDHTVEGSPVTVAMARLPDEPDPLPFLSDHLGLLAHSIRLPSCQHLGGPDHFHDPPPDMQSAPSELRSEKTERTGWDDLSTETYHAILKMQASLPSYEEPLCVRLGVKLLFYSAEKRKSVLDDLADWVLHSTVKDLKMILDKGQAGLRSVLQEFYTREIEQRRSRKRQKSLEDDEAYRENADVPGGLRTRSRSATPSGDQRKRLPPAYPRIPSVSGLPPRTPSLLPSVPAIQLAPSSISFGTVEKIHTGFSYDQPSSQAEKKAKLAAHFKQKAEELEDIESADLSLGLLSFSSPLGSPDTLPEIGDIVVDPVEEVGRKSEELLKQAKALQTEIRHGHGLIAHLSGQRHGSDTTESEVQAGPSVIHDRQSEEGCDSEHIENVSPTAAESKPLDKGAPQVQFTIDKRSETVVPTAPSASTDETGPKGRTPTDLKPPPSPPSSIDTTSTSSSERQRRLNYHLDGRRNSWTPGKTKSSASIGTSSGEAIHLQHTPSAAEHLLSVFAQPSATSPRKKRHRDSTVERLEAQAARAVVSNRLQHEASECGVAEDKLDERTKENTAVNAGRARRLSDVAAGLRKAADLPKERRKVELPPELQMTVARKPSEMSKREGKMPVRETTHKGTEGRRVSFSDPFDDGSMPDEKYRDLSKAMDLDVESGTSASEAVPELSDSLSRSPRYQQASLPPGANVVTEEVKDAPRKDSSRKKSDPNPESAGRTATTVTGQGEPSMHDRVDVLDFGDQAHTDAKSANDSKGATVVSNPSKSTPPISITQTSAGNNSAAASKLDLNSQQLTPARPRAPRSSSFTDPNRTCLPPPLDLSSQHPPTPNAAGFVNATLTSPVSLITAELEKRRREDRERREREELLRIDRERMERLARSECQVKRPLSRERGANMESVGGNQLSPTTPPPPPEHRIGARFEAKQMQQPDDELPPIPPSPRLHDDPHFDSAGLPLVHKSSPLTSDGNPVRSRRGAAGGSDFKKAMGFTRDEDSKGGDESDTVTENASDWEDEAEGDSKTPSLADQARASQERKERRKAERRQKDARTTTTTALAPAKKAPKTLAEVLNKKYEEVSKANQSEDVPGGTAERSLTRKRGVALPPVPTPSWVLQSVDGENAMAERGYFRAYAHIHQNMQWQMREIGHEKVWPPFPAPTRDPNRIQEGLRQMRQGNHEKAEGVLADGSGLKDLEMETLRRSVAWDPDRALETIRQIERRDGPGSAWIETSPAGTRVVLSAAGQRHDGQRGE
ncbi:hypothetical protein KC332_g5012 [Hortaea werneckii]|nr:hypothetical protein KC350_g13943 [Hortaea werneckii]KAI6845873.1 hypothetical protein KC358_g3136 [Hortaea werneckii]KAI6942414.1 hypothetical protein KC341_g2253 [Hortaea werneckii]KAI6947842.1 hypothetical protein KC348_g2288 [Hortaea werneckii]KAI6979900.1 hypothetical protein KC321_g2074 [Hortaea werneckii]